MDTNEHPKPPQKGAAIASLTLGILSIPTLGLLFIGGILGLVLGIVALNNIKREPERYTGRGLAIAGIVTSGISLLCAVPGLIAAIAIPNLVKSRQVASEVSAIHTVMTLRDAELQYSLKYGRFADLHTLKQFGAIDAVLAEGHRGGYLFAVEPSVNGSLSMFDITARPESAGTFGTGNRSFYCNETLVIYQRDGGEPPRATPSNRVPRDATRVE